MYAAPLDDENSPPGLSYGVDVDYTSGWLISVRPPAVSEANDAGSEATDAPPEKKKVQFAAS